MTHQTWSLWKYLNPDLTIKADKGFYGPEELVSGDHLSIAQTPLLVVFLGLEFSS